MPHLRALVQRMQDRPFTVLGVNSYDGEDAYRKGVEELQLSWPVLYQGGSTPVADLYRVQYYPTVYVLDEEGRIVAKDVDASSLGQLAERLVSALEARRRER